MGEKLRDPAKTVEHYEQLVANHQSETEFLRQTANKEGDQKRKAGLIRTFPQKMNDIALALYSAGADTRECKRRLGEAVDARMQFTEASGFRFEEYGFFNEDLRTFSGACLIGRQNELVEMHRKTKFDSNPVSGLIDLIEQYCDVLTGKPCKREVDERSLKKVAPDWLALPPLFQAVAERDQKRFAQQLETYLSTSWERYAKGLKRAIKNPLPIYFGTWNLLSAALCKIMGEVPDLSKKTRTYVPAELIDA